MYSTFLLIQYECIVLMNLPNESIACKFSFIFHHQFHHRVLVQLLMGQARMLHFQLLLGEAQFQLLMGRARMLYFKLPLSEAQFLHHRFILHVGQAHRAFFIWKKNTLITKYFHYINHQTKYISFITWQKQFHFIITKNLVHISIIFMQNSTYLILIHLKRGLILLKLTF